MTRATLADVLTPALRGNYAVAGFVCLGWEDSRAFVTAAEAERAPVILQAGPGCRAHTPLPVIASMFRHLADTATVPVVLHLDHGHSPEEVDQAISEGFTSVMFDGSALPFADNLRRTQDIATAAHRAGVSCEAELGVVGYADGRASVGTDPREARQFAAEAAIDALAVAVGNVHLQDHGTGEIDEQALASIGQATGGRLPLVIHGGSGVPPEQRRRIARETPVCKFNIGTELRQAFGSALRRTLAAEPEEYDRIRLLAATEPPLQNQARLIIRGLGSAGRAG